MTLRLLVTCDGTPADRPGMALERCRAYLPVEPRYLPTSQTIDPDSPIDVAHGAGWSQTPGGRDLCPACTRTRDVPELNQRVTACALTPEAVQSMTTRGPST